MNWKDGRGVPAPDAGPPPVYEVVYPRPGESLDVTILAATWWGFDAHWSAGDGSGNGRTTLCLHPDRCRGCAAGDELRWVGYLPAWWHRGRRRVILPLTRLASLTFVAALPDVAELRGVRLDISRAGKHKSSAWRIDRSSSPALKPMPPVPAIAATLLRIYGPDVSDLVARIVEADEGKP